MANNELLLTPDFPPMPLRQAFIEAGLFLLRSGGIDDLTLSNLLKQCGRARQSFYNTFNSKFVFEAEVYWYYFQPHILMFEQLAIDVQLDGQEKLSLWSSRMLNWIEGCINRGERILTLTEVSARYPEATPPSFLFKTLFTERTHHFAQIIFQSGSSGHCPSHTEDEAGLLLVMLDGVVTRAIQCQSVSLVEQFFSYNFPCQLIKHGFYE